MSSSRLQQVAFSWWHSLSEKEQRKLTRDYCKENGLLLSQFKLNHIIVCYIDLNNKPI